MLKRRDAILRAAGAGFLLRGQIAFAKAAQPSTAVNFDVPPNACDCHTHVFADPAKFPFWAGRNYTPETALPSELVAQQRALRMQRVVIVTASVYGTDNSSTLYAIRDLGARARGVAVIDDKTTDSALDTMARSGIRGVRLNIAAAGVAGEKDAAARFRAASDRVKSRNWHIQINTGLGVISGLKNFVRDSPATVVFDHFGGAQAGLGVEQPGFADLLDLVRSGKAYVKISNAYTRSTLAPGYADVAPIARALIAANVDRILWGSNWPHPGQTPPGKRASDITPLQQIDDGRILNLLATWVTDPAIRKKILVDNPARLYGF